MRDVFICDAVRTPIGRYGGALAKVRTDDLAAAPIKALIKRNPKVDWSALDEVYFGCANQAGEDNRNVARMALVARGPAGHRSGRHAQPALRLGARRGRHRRARDPRRRDRVRHRRRRGIDDARALRDGQGAGSVLAQRRDLRHHHRLALHQSADEAAIRRRFDAGDRRECRRGIPGHARRSGRVRACARSSAPARRSRRASSREEIVPVETPGGKAGPDRRRQGRASAPRHDARKPRQAEDAVPQSRHGDGRQCVGRQ